MTTANDIVTGALKRLRVIASDETPNAADAADGLAALNDMMHALDMEGVVINWASLASSGTFPLGARHEQGVKAMLAVRLAEDHGKPIGNRLGQDAVTGKMALQNDFSIIQDIKADPALLNMPSQRRVGHA